MRYGKDAVDHDSVHWSKESGPHEALGWFRLVATIRVESKRGGTHWLKCNLGTHQLSSDGLAFS